VEAATTANVRPEIEDELVENQVGNGQLDSYSFCSTKRSSFVLGYCQDQQLVVDGDEISFIQAAAVSRHHIHFQSLDTLCYIDTEVNDLNHKMHLVSFQRHLSDGY